MYLFLRGFVLLSMLAVPFQGFGATAGIPEGVVVVTAPEVRRMIEDRDVLFVNVLSRIEYEMQHIPGSINIPVDEVESTDELPKDKDARVIFYCNGMACPYSRRASILAVQQGYTRVNWFRGGILEWRKYQYPMQVSKELQRIKVAKLSPEDFIRTMAGDALVVDVRPRWWRQSKEQSGMVPGTQLVLPLMDLPRNLHLLPKGRPILLVDRLMRQSVPAAKYLTLHGYNVVGVLRGGSKRWAAESRPLLARQDEPPVVPQAQSGTGKRE